MENLRELRAQFTPEDFHRFLVENGYKLEVAYTASMSGRTTTSGAKEDRALCRSVWPVYVKYETRTMPERFGGAEYTVIDHIITACPEPRGYDSWLNQGVPEIGMDRDAALYVFEELLRPQESVEAVVTGIFSEMADALAQGERL